MSQPRLLRVAHVDHTVEPGGAEIALRRMLAAGADWHATIFVPPSDVGLGEFASHGDAVRVIGVPQRAGAIAAAPAERLTMLASAIVQSGALRLSRDFRRSAVVHANSSRAAIIALLATAGSRRRLVVHLRDAVDEAALGSLAVRALRLVLPRADGVIANSRYTLASAEQWIGERTRVAVIPSPTGHDGSRIPSVPRSEVRVIGMLARLAPWKGQAHVIEAFATAFPASGVRLQLAGSAAFGETAYAHELARLASEHGVADRVDFLGHVDDIWALVEQWDVCVHASTRPEPLGQNVLQYLAAARPTIATRAGGPLEWIDDGETGLLVEMADVPSLAHAMRRLADERDLRERLFRTLVARRPVPSDAETVRAHAAFFASINGAGARSS